MSDAQAPPGAGKQRRSLVVGLILLALAVGAAAAPLLRWQLVESARTSCQSNERKLAVGLLMYSQDFDGALPQPEHQTADGRWHDWIEELEPYTDAEESAECPANRAGGARSASSGAPYGYSYALNYRFYGVFGPGPFPVENLEIPAQTALIVESGRQRTSGPFGASGRPIAASAYTDTAETPDAYPSPHDGRMNVAAADAHSVSVRVAHYRAGGHDPLYGRLGGRIYNWNGGHPNRDTAGPPIE